VKSHRQQGKRKAELPAHRKERSPKRIHSGSTSSKRSASKKGRAEEPQESALGPPIRSSGAPPHEEKTTSYRCTACSFEQIPELPRHPPPGDKLVVPKEDRWPRFCPDEGPTECELARPGSDSAYRTRVSLPHETPVRICTPVVYEKRLDPLGIQRFGYHPLFEIDELRDVWLLQQALEKRGSRASLTLADAVKLVAESFGRISMFHDTYRLERRNPSRGYTQNLLLMILIDAGAKELADEVYAAFDETLAPDDIPERYEIYAPFDIRRGIEEQAGEHARRLGWIRECTFRLATGKDPARPAKHDVARDTYVYLRHTLSSWTYAQIAEDLVKEEQEQAIFDEDKVFSRKSLRQREAELRRIVGTVSRRLQARARSSKPGS
jgi:hypothetical protein